MAHKHENTFPLMHRVLVASTRTPDEFWVVCETEEDVRVVQYAIVDLIELELLDGFPDCLRLVHLPTPASSTAASAAYDVIPYSHKINYALDLSEADAFVYLDNGSIPAPEKYEVMAAELARGHYSVYCTQERTGFARTTFGLQGAISSPFCVLNFTQVMHGRTPARWSLDMRDANPDIADGKFFVDLVSLHGPIFPAGGEAILDFHHIPHPAAAHLQP